MTKGQARASEYWRFKTGAETVASCHTPTAQLMIKLITPAGAVSTGLKPMGPCALSWESHEPAMAAKGSRDSSISLTTILPECLELLGQATTSWSAASIETTAIRTFA